MPLQKFGELTGAQVRKLLVASVVIAAAASSAPVLAADLPPVAVVPVVLGYDWDGFYLGGHVGGATDSVNFNQTDVTWSSLPGGFPGGPPGTTSVNTGESGTLGATSVTGGLQVGYNWVLPNLFLFGLEADISGAGLSSSTSTSPPGDPLAVAQWNDKLDVYGSARTRLGWISNTWLFYGTGGFGWAYDKFTRTQVLAPINAVTPPFVDINALETGTVVTNSRFRPGWVAGAGVEWAFARTWTVKLEYLHFDTSAETLAGGHFNYIGPVPHNQASSSVTAPQGDLTIDTIRVGINRSFN